MIVSLDNYQNNIVSSPDKVYELMKFVFNKRDDIDRDRENAWVISLNNSNKVLDVDLVSMGTQNMTLIDPKEIFCKPLRIRAARIILVHNHPSGNWIPSLADIDCTDGLIQVGKLVSIPILDHIILSCNGYFSFASFELMDLLQRYSFYSPIPELQNKEEIISKRLKFCIKKLEDISKFKIENQKNIRYRKNYV